QSARTAKSARRLRDSAGPTRTSGRPSLAAALTRRSRLGAVVYWLPAEVFPIFSAVSRLAHLNTHWNRSMSVLSDLVAALNAGELKIVDLTQPLGPDTPVIGLPPIFASSPG